RDGTRHDPRCGAASRSTTWAATRRAVANRRGVSGDAMRWKLTLVVLGVLALAVGLAIRDQFHVGVFHDDAMYVVLARALATGQGYRWTNLPDAPLASHFPPGFPLVLAAISRVGPSFPANLLLFKTFNALCLAAVTVLIAQLTRERFASEGWGATVGVLAAIG